MNNGRVQSHDGSGRPKATADQVDRLIARSAVAEPDSSLLTIRRLIERNVCSYQPLRHLPLTPAHCRATLHWCLARSGWNHDDWGRIVLRDESRFQLYPDDHRICVWRRPWQRADPAFTIAR
ncbi:HTH_Tnp_Tc3_2 domain-containing protein [Trichonephila clavipes]|nr:HTH_Tnp_Tc3_2 domain-containing protein [Trichonephila clavipes]